MKTEQTDEGLDAIPISAYELIDLLDRLYPQRCINVGESLEEAHRYAGSREVVDRLISWKAEELESASVQVRRPE